MITLKGPRGVALLRKTPEESEAEIINEIEGKIRDAIQFLRKNKNKNKIWEDARNVMRQQPREL